MLVPSKCSRSVSLSVAWGRFSWVRIPWSGRPSVDIWRTTQTWRGRTSIACLFGQLWKQSNTPKLVCHMFPGMSLGFTPPWKLEYSEKKISLLSCHVKILLSHCKHASYYLGSHHCHARSYAVFTRDTFTRGKCIFTIENVTQYNRNVNLRQVNVSRVTTALDIQWNLP